MTAEVETMFSRELPWHKQGTVTGRTIATAAEALELAEVDWTVKAEPIYALTDGGFKKVDGKVANVRSSDNSVLGIVGDTYQQIQNSTLYEFASGLGNQAPFVSGGSLKEGTIVWCTLELDQDLTLPDGSKVCPYLHGATSHDGSLAFKFFTAPLIVVCMNTLVVAQEKAVTSWTIRHTANAEYRIEQAQRMLQHVTAYYEGFTETAHEFINQHVSDVEFERLVKSIFPMPKGSVTQRVIDNTITKRNRVVKLWQGGTIGNFKNTAWGALNAFNEYELWYQNVRGMERAERHALRIFNEDFPLTEQVSKVLVAAR